MGINSPGWQHPTLGRGTRFVVLDTTCLYACCVNVAAAVALLGFSAVLCSPTTVTSSTAAMTSPTRWLAPCSGASDVTATSRDITAEVTGTPPTTNTDDLAATFRKISVKMRRLKNHVRDLKNIYVSHHRSCWFSSCDVLRYRRLDMERMRVPKLFDEKTPKVSLVATTIIYSETTTCTFLASFCPHAVAQ